MIKRLLNEYRMQNGKQLVVMDNWEEDQYARWHCLYMAKIQECCHAPEYLRQRDGYILSEVVAGRSFFHTPDETLRTIILEQIANSPEHKDIILSNDNLACAFHVEHYYVFVCIRGW